MSWRFCSLLSHLAILPVLGLLALECPVHGETPPMLKPPPAPGGLAAGPVITAVEQTGDTLSVHWFGVQGPYQLQRSSSATSERWWTLASTTATNVTLPWSGDPGVLRVVTRPTAPGAAVFAGAESCWLCHIQAPENWAETPHGQAFTALKSVGQQDNASCLPCHTVGAGTPAGFIREATTPHLAGVQCENCHGPAGGHLAHILDRTARPKVTVAAEVCGGCHNMHRPTFDEWKQSPHATQNSAVATLLQDEGEGAMRSCGPCHSGAVRLAMLSGVAQGGLTLPNRQDAADISITCAVCHDPHAPAGAAPGRASLRNPLFSLHDYSLNPSVDFASQYDPTVQMCGQCHNLAGASWQDVSRPPHPSPQYNVLIGRGGYDQGATFLGGHGDTQFQCVGCHSGAESAGLPTLSGSIGHTFQVNDGNCAVCHITVRAAEKAREATQQRTRNQIEEIKDLLDRWALTRAPGDLRNRYGARAWEYAHAGPLSNPSADAALQGPSEVEQGQVPDAIKQARFNLYLVYRDGSFGVHNGTYARQLLAIARNNVNSLLAAP